MKDLCAEPFRLLLNTQTPGIIVSISLKMHLSFLLATATSISVLATPTPLKWLSSKNLAARDSTFPQPYARSNVTKSYCPPRPAPEPYQRQIFDGFINALYTEKDVIGAFDTYIAEDLIEHDPFDAQGRAANAAKLSNIIPFVPSTVLRHSFANNVGLIHVRVDEEGHRPIALADIYRMNGTCIVEHWDVTQETPANATNAIAMF